MQLAQQSVLEQLSVLQNPSGIMACNLQQRTRTECVIKYGNDYIAG